MIYSGPSGDKSDVSEVKEVPLIKKHSHVEGLIKRDSGTLVVLKKLDPTKVTYKTSKGIFNYLKNEFENFSTHNNFGDSFFIENFDSPTVSDFCWYSFFIYCIKDTSHSPIITSYNYILDYVNKMEDHIINIESEEEEKEEEEEEKEEEEEEGEENRELKKDV